MSWGTRAKMDIMQSISAEIGADAAKTKAAAPLGAPTEIRPGLALALSGGGFRAALFHLGALRCLNEHGILSRVSTIHQSLAEAYFQRMLLPV